MDLRLLDAEPTDAERAAVDAVVGTAAAGDGRVVRGDRHRRHLLLPALRAAQRRVGWVSEGALGYASRRLDVPPADAYGVASFYALLALEERPADVLHVCTDLACALAGAEVPEGAHASPCLGLCERAPAALRTIAGETPREIQLPETGPPLPQSNAGLKLLRRIADGRRSGVSLDDYRALARAARARGPERVIRGRRKVVGRAARPRRRGVPDRREVGGGRGPAGARRTTSSATPTSPSPARSRTACSWSRIRSRSSRRWRSPTYATGCEKGFVYIRGGVSARARARATRSSDARRRAPRRLRHRAAHRRRRLRLRRGDRALPVDRGLPRRAAQQAAVPRRGRPLRQAHGREQRRDARERAAHPARRSDPRRRRDSSACRGTSRAPACTSSSSARRCARSSTSPARSRRRRSSSAAPPARSCGPTSSTCRSRSRARATAGATLGSGVVLVFDEHADLTAAVLRIAEFFRDESCGQCVPCRVGTVRQEEALHRLAVRRDARERGRRRSPTSRRSCATHRSAGSARPRRAPSSRR